MDIAPYKPLEARDLKRLPARSISDLEWTMSEGLHVQLYSADGRRSVDVDCAALQEAMNDCVVMAEACQLDLVSLGGLLDQLDHAQRDRSLYAKIYVERRITDPYWQQRARHIVERAPDGSGTREALRYLLATIQARNVLY
ncbi:hypothetical protein CDEF62S_04192 [Castellaniella defragrans]